MRVFPGEIARIEVPKAEVPRLTEWMASLSTGDREHEIDTIGFADVQVALEGFVSGNLNAVEHAALETPFPKLPIL